MLRNIVLILMLSNLLLAQGYLRNDDVTTHTSGITINEVSARSNPVDFNADGTVGGSDEDEFIEIVNSSGSSIDMTGWTLGDNSASVFTFPETVLDPGKAVIIFTRGADVSNFNPGPGNFVYATASTFALAVFSAEAVGIRNLNDLYIAVNWEEGSLSAEFLTGTPTLVGTNVALDAWNAGQSQSRSPDYTGSWGQHPTITGTVNWSQDSPTVTLTDPEGSPGRKVGEDSPLPVELASFRAIAGNATVILRWETHSETDNAGFILMRSDGHDADYREISSYAYDQTLKGAGSTSQNSRYTYVDKHLTNGMTYWYKLIDVDVNGVRTEHPSVSAIPVPDYLDADISAFPALFSLKQNYPNPFNPSTRIRFDVPELKDDVITITLNIYNHLGQKVRTLYSGPVSAGEYELEWNGLDDANRKLASGVYFYQLYSSEFAASRRMLLMK